MRSMELNRFNSVLAVGAHPDDLEYACFGFLMKQHEAGSNIFIYIASPDSRGNGSQYYERVKESTDSFSVMPNANLIFRNTNKVFPDNYEKISDEIRDIILNNNIDLVLVHDKNDDTHQEHRLMYDIVMTATRRMPVNIFTFKSPSIFNGFKANYLVDISKYYEEKVKAVKKHKTQLNMPYMSEDSLSIFNQPWSGKLLGIDHTEEFRIVRMIG